MKQLVALIAFTSTIIAFSGVKQFNLEAPSYSCKQGKSALTLNLVNHPILKITNSFSVSFWISFKEAAVVLSLQSDKGTLQLQITQDMILRFGSAAIGPLKPAQSLEGSDLNQETNPWHFVMLAVKVESDGAPVTYRLYGNTEVSAVGQVATSSDSKSWALVLGGGGVSRTCETAIRFHSVSLMDGFIEAGNEEIITIIGGFLRPVFLSVFPLEGTSSKWQTNLIRSGLGDMSNGENPNSFSQFTSLGSSANIMDAQMTLTNDLSILRLPKGLLSATSPSQSYVFAIHYSFFYKDSGAVLFNNTYQHVIYMRQGVSDRVKRIRAWLSVAFHPNEPFRASQCYYAGAGEPVRTDFLLPGDRSGQIREVKLNFLVIQVVHTALSPQASVSFLSGYDNSQVSMLAGAGLRTDDWHQIGDSDQGESSRKELLSFVQVTEVAFFRGSYLYQPVESDPSKALVTDGFSANPVYVSCQGGVPPQRLRDSNPNLVTLSTCQPFVKQICSSVPNCDVCLGQRCLQCQVGYQLTNSNSTTPTCVKCGLLEGFDPILRKCYTGTLVNSFQDTQYSNLKSVPMSVDLQNNHFTTTVKLDLKSQSFRNSQLLLFVNNIDNENRMVDSCWNEACGMSREMYFAMTRSDLKLNIENLIIGNTGEAAIDPVLLVLGMKNPDDFKAGDLVHKNFDCRFARGLVYQPLNSVSGSCAASCSNGFYLDNDTGRCVRCDSSCASCNAVGSCLTCQPGYAFIDGACVLCSSSCKTCEGSTNFCTSCANSAMLENGTCDKLCSNLKSRNCDACDSKSGLCTQCLSGFVLSGGFCLQASCIVRNCLTCESESVCRTCATGFVLSADRNSCVVCRENCKECPTGFELKNGSCSETSNITIQPPPQKTETSARLFTSIIVSLLLASFV